VKRSEIQIQYSARFLLKWVSFATFETPHKNVIVKMPQGLVWSSETLESKALIPNVMKPAQEKIEKIDQRLRIQPL